MSGSDRVWGRLAKPPVRGRNGLPSAVLRASAAPSDGSIKLGSVKERLQMASRTHKPADPFAFDDSQSDQEASRLTSTLNPTESSHGSSADRMRVTSAQKEAVGCRIGGKPQCRRRKRDFSFESDDEKDEAVTISRQQSAGSRTGSTSAKNGPQRMVQSPQTAMVPRNHIHGGGTALQRTKSIPRSSFGARTMSLEMQPENGEAQRLSAVLAKRGREADDNVISGATRLFTFQVHTCILAPRTTTAAEV
jgi:hypothetical protein